MPETHDAVDVLLEEWRTQRPDLDTRPMAVVGRLSRAARLLDQAIADRLTAHGLQGWEFDVLATLRRARPPHRLTTGQLAAASMISPSTGTHRIDRLAERGLVTREQAPDNRRQVLVALTERGRALVDDAVEAHLENEQSLLAPLTTTEQDMLARLLRRLLLGLGDVRPEA